MASSDPSLTDIEEPSLPQASRLDSLTARIEDLERLVAYASDLGEVGLSRLGLVPNDASAAGDNTEILNAYYAGDYLTDPRKLSLQAQPWHINDTIVQPPKTGGAQDSGGGETIWLGDFAYDSNGLGGRVGRYIASSTMTAKPMFSYTGLGFDWGNVVLQGCPVDFQPDSFSDFSPETRAKIGLLVNVNPVTPHSLGTGKVISQNFIGLYLQRVVECGVDATGDNADQLNFSGRCAGYYCDEFLRLNNRQSLSHTINHMEQGLCKIAYHCFRGGEIQTNMHVAGEGCEYGLVTGDQTLSSGPLGAEGLFHWNFFKVDNTASADYCIWDMRNKYPGQSGGFNCPATVQIEMLEMPYNRDFFGLFNLKPGGNLVINGGEGLGENCVVATGGTTTNMITVSLSNHRMKYQVNPRSIVNDGSISKVEVVIGPNVRDYYGGTYPQSRFLFNNGVISDMSVYYIP